MSTNGFGGSDDWRDTDFGHGQERYYGGASVPPPPQDPRSTPVEEVSSPSGGGRGKGPLLAGTGVLVVALVAGGVYLATRSDSPQVASGPTGGASGPHPEPSAAVDTQTRTTAPTGPQRNAGGADDHATFDVPAPGSFTTGKGTTAPVWRMYKDPRDRAGYGSITGKNVSMGHAPTFYRDGFCKTSPTDGLGLFVWASAQGDSPLEAASGVGSKWLESVATRDDGKVEKYDKTPSVKNVTLKHSKTKAVQFRATTPYTEAKPKACGLSSAEVTVTAFETGKGTATLVAVRKLGHPDSMTPQQLASVLDTLRPS